LTSDSRRRLPNDTDVTLSKSKSRLLVFIVAYNAEKTIERVLQRIPASLASDYDVEILVIDDASQDCTFEASRARLTGGRLPFKMHVLTNPVNQGYGGNQKLGYHFAIEQGFDIVALIHGDGQYAPERLPELVRPISDGKADGVLGSRMMTLFGALKGGMPLYKYVGNRILTWIQNRLLKTRLAEFHTGYRIYSVAGLKKLPFELNSNDFHFDTEIIIQLLRAGLRITEVPIPTYYGNEISYVNGFKYAGNVLAASFKARAQDLGFFYDRKFDCAPIDTTTERYESKQEWASPHSIALEMVGTGGRVLDLGCASGSVGASLMAQGCSVTGVDLEPDAGSADLDDFIRHDLNDPSLPIDVSRFDYVLMLDVIEHLRSPEAFLDMFRDASQSARDTLILASTGNIGFIITRLLLLFGLFNYGKRGILDITHTRLFTLSAFKRLFLQAGFDVVSVRGVPAPFPLALGGGRAARVLLWINQVLIRISKRVFSYQIFLVVRPRPSLNYLMREAHRESAERAQQTSGSHIERTVEPSHLEKTSINAKHRA